MLDPAVAAVRLAVREALEPLAGSGASVVVALSGGAGRAHGSNKHLAGFLKDDGKDRDEGPYVLVTTSLLSRGLDFAPSVRHVLIVDEPRNVVDLLHRAGRSARAGREGTLTVFGSDKGAEKAVRALS